MNTSLEYARGLDKADELGHFRDQFHIPKQQNGEDHIYLCGNSLGLQPKSTKAALEQELEDWAKYGVEGHFHAKHPWMPYHECLTSAMAKVVGGHDDEVVVMNTLSVNLHLLMVSFYRPTKTRFKILIEADAFPSDVYAVESQIAFHGYDAATSCIKVKPREGEHTIRLDDLLEIIAKEGDEIALILIGNTNYYTGQFFDMKTITEAGHKVGAKVGFDCAHGAGNVPLELHDTGADFAVWCSYKYLNSGPGSLGGCFIHQRHLKDKTIPRFAGWWGHNKETRFGMRDGFDPIPTAEAWQLSNPPILSMAAIKASLELFDEAGIYNLRTKAIALTNYMESLLKEQCGDDIEIITPGTSAERGSQLSIFVKQEGKALFESITKAGVIADWREPNVIRVSPVPMYNSYADAWKFANVMSQKTKA